ncbi:unnamed protein product [Alopecurus aequalis]
MSCEMATTLRRGPSSPAAPPLEDDNLLAEILLRLPPLPSSLPRVSAVCKRWRGLASDPRFSRRFRAHHRRNAPLLGFFITNIGGTSFQPALEAPNRIPQGRFSFPIHAHDVFGCRHGLVLSFHSRRKQLLVWDPVIGDQHRLDIPPGFDTKVYFISAAVFRAAEDVHDFQVVLISTSHMQDTQVVASVYSSKTNIWGNITMPTVPPMYVDPQMPAVMLGDSLYWVIDGGSSAILEFDVGRRSLSVIPMPPEIITDRMAPGDFWVIMAEGGGLGFLLLSGFNAQLWKRKMNSDGVASWVLQRTIALDNLLSINSEKERQRPVIRGFAEDNNAVLLRTSIGVFMVQLEPLQFNKVFESKHCERYLPYPFEVVYTTSALMVDTMELNFCKIPYMIGPNGHVVGTH